MIYNRLSLENYVNSKPMIMKNLLLLILVLSLFACNPKKKGKEVKQYTIEQFYKNKSVSGSSFSYDESKLLVSSNETGIYNVFALPVDGSDPLQLTNSEKESVFAVSYFPNDERAFLSSDQGGNEIRHIYLRETDGTMKDITPWEGVTSSFGGWKRDNTGFYVASNKRDKRYFDLYEMDIESFEGKMIYKNEKGLDIGSLSESQRFIALTQNITTSSNKLFLVDIKNNKTIELSEGEANYNPEFFDLAEENLYYTTNDGGEFTYLVKYNIETGTKEKAFEDQWDISYAYNSYNEKYRVIGVNKDAKIAVYVFDQETGKELTLPGFDNASVLSVSISKSEKLMKLSVGKTSSPTNIYIYNIETQELKQLTSTLNPEINEDDLVNAEVIRYKSFDGLEIPAILYKPHQASADNKVPALVSVHGGPGGQSMLYFRESTQYLVNHGYAVLAVNNRGSSGYGKTFYRLDDQKHGEDDLQDCIEGKEYLKTLDWVDGEKIGIIGGSYGGYMVMAALTYAPEEFDVGVNLFGVTNWLRTLKSIPPYWESFKKALYEEMGDPYTEDSVRLYNISPLFHADKVTKPLMVLQGTNDPRVLQVESDEIVEAVKANGVPVEYVLFPDEGHGFVKKVNNIKANKEILLFLDKYLKQTEN